MIRFIGEPGTTRTYDLLLRRPKSLKKQLFENSSKFAEVHYCYAFDGSIYRTVKNRCAPFNVRPPDINLTYEPTLQTLRNLGEVARG